MSDYIIVIPALNAEPYVAAVVEAALPHRYPVLVVDDGSSDQTGEIARSAGATVLRHERNRGKGGALKTGFEWALGRNAKAVITLDADGQHLPAQVPMFVQRFRDSEADLIIGSRDHLFGGMLPRRRAANRFSAWAISIASGVHIPDSQSGFRLYSSRLLREVEISANGFDAESEVLVRAGRAGYFIESIPIDLGFVNGISTSHYRAVADTLRIARRVALTRLQTF